MNRILILAAALLLPVQFLTALPAAAIAPQQVVSGQGVEGWLVEDHSNPIIAVEFAFKSGAASDPADKAGLSSMVAGLLDEGAGDMDSQTFQGKLEDLAVGISFSAGQDAVYGHLKTVTANKDTAVEMMRLALTQPRFDADAVERIRGQMLTALKRERQDPDSIAGRAFAKQVYGDHPYARSTEGEPETVKSITAADLKAYVPARLTRDVLTVGIVGDITPDQAKTLLDSLFGGLSAKNQAAPVSDYRPQTQGKTQVLRHAIPQSVVLFGQDGLKRDDPDWYAAYVMNYILGGGGFSSRLMSEVRVKRGLAYGIYSYLVPHDHAALIEGSVGTRNDKVAETIQITKAEWARMAQGGVTEQELADAKRYLNGSFPLQLDSTSSIAALLVTIQMEHLGMDYLDRRDGLINAVTAADVQRVAKRLLDPAKLDMVILGDPQGL